MRHSGAELQAEGARIADEWAREHGHRDRNEAYDAGVTCFDICKDIIGKPNRIPGPVRGRWKPTSAALRELGVTVTEYRPTPEEMQKARRDLGLPEPGEDTATVPSRRQRRKKRGDAR